MQYGIGGQRQEHLKLMCEEGNYGMAIQKIADWSGTEDVIEITDKFYTRMLAKNTTD
jgi:hypothetical protein